MACYFEDLFWGGYSHWLTWAGQGFVFLLEKWRLVFERRMSLHLAVGVQKMRLIWERMAFKQKEGSRDWVGSLFRKRCLVVLICQVMWIPRCSPGCREAAQRRGPWGGWCGVGQEGHEQSSSILHVSTVLFRHGPWGHQRDSRWETKSLVTMWLERW